MKTATFPLSFFNKVYHQFTPYFEDDDDILSYKGDLFIQAILPPSVGLEEEEAIFSEGEELQKFVAHFNKCTIIGWCKAALERERVVYILRDFVENIFPIYEILFEKKE